MSCWASLGFSLRNPGVRSCIDAFCSVEDLPTLCGNAERVVKKDGRGVFIPPYAWRAAWIGHLYEFVVNHE